MNLSPQSADKRIVNLFALLIALGVTSHALVLGSTSGTIIQSTRVLRMTSTELPVPKAYFIDLGARDGVKEGSVVEVRRELPVLAAFSGRFYQFVSIVLGELKMMAVGEYSSLGSVQTQKDPKQLPAMEYPMFMVGDVVELKTDLPFH